jgi:chromosomal replication initiator protein
MNDMTGQDLGKSVDAEAPDRDIGALSARAVATDIQRSTPAARANVQDQRNLKLHKQLRATLGEEVYSSWFNAVELGGVVEGTVRLSVPVKFLKSWIQSHYTDQMLACCRSVFEDVDRVEIVVREPGAHGAKTTPAQKARSDEHASPSPRVTPPVGQPPRQPGSAARSQTALEGSPLDMRATFDTFVVGASNRMAHAGAKQVAETVFSETRAFNPLCIHAGVGMGKTHLLQAIAWEVRRRMPSANVLYLTAERFRLQFVEAVRAQDTMAFKDRFRNVDILLIDDLEFLHGHQTEQEFDFVVNNLLDSGRQLVVASARPPSQIERLNDRMRSRLQRGLVTEIRPLDQDLRRRVLERRISEKQSLDQTFEVSRDVLELFAERLPESGRELEGAATRLLWQWQNTQAPITIDVAESLIRDLVHGTEPKRIKIEDILKVTGRYFNVSRQDLLSQRRHRSVVWPRQIGMYLAKQLTARSLPEIGRRFGNRDHTTVLHAIRKIDALLPGDAKLRATIEELKKEINQ